MKNETQRMGVEQELIQSVTNSLSFPETKKAECPRENQQQNKAEELPCSKLEAITSLHLLHSLSLSLRQRSQPSSATSVEVISHKTISLLLHNY